MSKIKEGISNRLRKFQFESQTVPLQNAPVYIKIMAFVYQLIGRKLLAQSLVSSSECDACNICVKVCPNQAIKLNRDNPHRNNKCKGCLLCVYSCPKRVFYLPVISLIGAVLLLFLPYDNWIIKISSLKIVPEMGYLKYQVISFILWAIGYAIIVFLFEKIIYLLSTIPAIKKLGKITFIKKFRNKIHPALIFPIIVRQVH